MKLPIYFEAFGSIGVTVSFVTKTTRADKPYHGTVTMLLCECPDAMREAVNSNPSHFVKKNSGYELDVATGRYKLSEPL